MIQYQEINHLALATGDLEGTIRFWRDLLGMRLVLGLGRAGSRLYFFAAGGQTLIGFFQWAGVEPLPEKEHGYPASGPVGFDHVSVGVARRDDLWELRDRLDAAGFWTSEVLDHGFIHSLYSFDPNGIAIEFSWAVPGMHPARRPFLGDRDAPAEALAGPEPQPGRWPEPKARTAEADKVAYPGEGTEITEPERDLWRAAKT